MKIGFDFDGILVSYPLLIPSFVIDYFYRNNAHALSYRFPGLFEQKVRLFSHHIIFRPPLKKNIADLSKLAKNENLEIYLISGRFGFLKEKTHVWLETHNLNHYFTKIFFNFDNQQPHIFKNKTIKKYKIELFIDDDLPLLEYLANKNPNVTFFWFNKKNQKKLRANLLAITNIADIL